MTSAMNLQELQPKEVKFTVSEIELTLRPFTIADDLAAEMLLGGKEKVSEAFVNWDVEKLSLLAWHQLTLESQKSVVAADIEAEKIDPDTGETIKVDLTPLQKFRSLFWSVKDKAQLVRVLCNCRALNIPELDDVEGLGKWLEAILPVIKKHQELTGQ